MAAVTAVAVLGGGKPAAHVQAGPPPTLPPIPTTRPGTLVGLAEGVLSAADVGGGWTASPAATPLAERDYTAGPCASPLWARDVAGEHSELQNGGGGLVHDGIVESVVREAADTKTAEDQAAFVTSPSFVPCVKAEVDAGLSDVFAGTSIQIGQISVDPLTLSQSSATIGFAITITLFDPTRQATGSITDDHVELFTGVYEGAVDLISDVTNPLPSALVQQEANRMADRLSALPPNGTLAAHAV